MPRQLLRDGVVADDEWVYESAATPSSPDASRVIVPFDQWRAERERWSASQARLGVVLLPAHKIEDLVPDLARFDLVAAEFSGPSEGRGYTQARLLRERYQFKGEVRATGYVRYDQVFFMARCGFNSFELPEAELARDESAFNTFSARYQPTNDVGLPHRLVHRRGATRRPGRRPPQT